MDEITRTSEKEPALYCADGAFGASGALRGTERSGYIHIAYLAAALAVTVGAALASRRLFAPGTLSDPFALCSTWAEWAVAAERLLCPALCAFLAVYAAAFSPFAIPVSLGALAASGAVSGISFFALADGARSGSIPTACVFAAVLYALSALALPVFAARACELSPAARSLRFSSFCGRREAAALTLSFFTLSGAAALLCVASALILRFGR